MTSAEISPSKYMAMSRAFSFHAVTKRTVRHPRLDDCNGSGLEKLSSIDQLRLTSLFQIGFVLCGLQAASSGPFNNPLHVPFEPMRRPP